MTSARISGFAAQVSKRLKARSRVLEIGCGSGDLTALLRAKDHYVVAVDPKAPESMEALRIRFEEFDAPPRYFDAVVMQLVLHHADALDALLDKVLATLRPDGIIAVDDYGWERAGPGVDEGWKNERRDLHTSVLMLRALRKRFVQQTYTQHAYFDDGMGEDQIAFTFIGAPSQGWPRFIGGPEKRKIVLAEHNADWRLRFKIERRRIVSALGARVKRVEHIGSTAVPHLAAKPIVDILVAVDDPLDEDVRAALESAGYQLRVEEPEHRMFRTAQLDVHVHLFAADSPEIERHLEFRDRLRTSAGDREAYLRVKRELAKRDWTDVNDYAQAKAAVVAQILARAQGKDASRN